MEIHRLKLSLLIIVTMVALMFIPNGNCQTTAKSKAAFCAEAGDGFHTHPDDCTKFVRCVGSHGRFDFDCAPGTVFDPVLMICNWAGAGGAPANCVPKTAHEIVFGRGKTPPPSKAPEQSPVGLPSKPEVQPRIPVPAPDNVRAASPRAPATTTTTTTKAPSSLTDLISQGLPSNVNDPFASFFPDKPKPKPSPMPLTPETLTEPATPALVPQPLLPPQPPSIAPTTTSKTTTTTTTTTTTPQPDVCTCNINGSLSKDCDPAGNCNCKKNVDGPRCNSCKEGHFNLDAGNKFGCSACFCFGHANKCGSAAEFNDVPIRSPFSSDAGAWRAVDETGAQADLEWVRPLQLISITSKPDRGRLYFSAPSSYLGEQRRSYGRRLNITLYITNERDYVHSNFEPIIIIEGSGLRVSMPIFGTPTNPYPEEEPQIYSFKLDPETPGPGWQPRLSKPEFLKLLSDVTAIKIRGSFTPTGTTFLDNVFMETARMTPEGPPDFGVEDCQCPEEYTGRSCEKCAEGFMKATCDGDAFDKCVPCDCKAACADKTACDCSTGLFSAFG